MLPELALVALLTVNTVQDIPKSKLREIYWDCDAAYMQGKISPDDMLPCIEIYDEFKRRYFAGDWDRFLEYWRKNRLGEWRKRGYTHQD